MLKIPHGNALQNRAKIRRNKMAALNDRNFGFFFLFCFFVLEFLRNELLSTADYFVGHKEYLMILFLLFSIFRSSLCDRYDAQVIIKIKDVFRKLKSKY